MLLNILKNLPQISKMFPRISFNFKNSFYFHVNVPMVLKNVLSLSKSYAKFRKKMLICTTRAGRLATPLMLDLSIEEHKQQQQPSKAYSKLVSLYFCRAP